MHDIRTHSMPWDRWFPTRYIRGAIAHELQVGPLVVQWCYEPHRGKRLHVWRDMYWRR